MYNVHVQSLLVLYKKYILMLKMSCGIKQYVIKDINSIVDL